MNFTARLVLIAITIAIVVVVRPAEGESARFLKFWSDGQVYALAAMVSAVMGVTVRITAWSF